MICLADFTVRVLGVLEWYEIVVHRFIKAKDLDEAWRKAEKYAQENTNDKIEWTADMVEEVGSLHDLLKDPVLTIE